MTSRSTRALRMSSLENDCPAFSGACPYSNAMDTKDSRARKATASSCPAFKDGCPYKSAKDLNELASLMHNVPKSHTVGGDLYGSVLALQSIMASIHDRSTEIRKNIGQDCPVFSTSCPFKSVTSNGAPLVTELEYRTWSVFRIDDELADQQGIPLAKHLKAGTKKSHRAAENVHFVRNFIKGQIDTEVYKHLVVSLWHTYTALENELRKNSRNVVYEKLHFPKELERQASLEKDLEFYFGDGWQNDEAITAPPSACTQEYVDRIRQIGNSQPELLVAHAYTRYLGDLSGGQTLMRVAKKAMGLPESGEGTSFYQFEHIPNAKDFKKKYRELLDNTSVDSTLSDFIVAEANLAFVMNMRVFEELDVLAGHTESVRSLPDVLKTLEMPVSENKKCPFASFGGTNPHAQEQSVGKAMTGSEIHETGQCPFPFILLHDPIKGIQDPLFGMSIVIYLVYILLVKYNIIAGFE